jgi:hypothetical protein
LSLILVRKVFRWWDPPFCLVRFVNSSFRLVFSKTLAGTHHEWWSSMEPYKMTEIGDDEWWWFAVNMSQQTLPVFEVKVLFNIRSYLGWVFPWTPHTLGTSNLDTWNISHSDDHWL